MPYPFFLGLGFQNLPRKRGKLGEQFLRFGDKTDAAEKGEDGPVTDVARFAFLELANGEDADARLLCNLFLGEVAEDAVGLEPFAEFGDNLRIGFCLYAVFRNHGANIDISLFISKYSLKYLYIYSDFLNLSLKTGRLQASGASGTVQRPECGRLSQ